MSIFTRQSINAVRACLFATPLIIAACASQPEMADEPVAEQPGENSVDRSSTAPTAIANENDARALPSQRVILFDFDDTSVGSDYQALLVAHGEYLADNDGASLRLEGHADERGTREYNVGLGERRAISVRQLLLLQGARDEQIEVLSYGEESPVVAESNERGWRQNRRVEFNYLSE